MRQPVNFYPIFVGASTIVVYGTCAIAVLTSERYSRSLFTVKNALSHKRDALASQRDVTRSVMNAQMATYLLTYLLKFVMFPPPSATTYVRVGVCLTRAHGA